MQDKTCLKCKYHDLIVFPLGVTVDCTIKARIFQELLANTEMTHDELDIALKLCANKCDRYEQTSRS